MEQLLKINGEIVDIDEKTAIGIDFQKYDIKRPSARYAPVSNAFSLPSTARNRAITGFAGDAQSVSAIPYTQLTCDYYVGGLDIIRNGYAKLNGVSDRINMFAAAKAGIWEQLKNVSWLSFQEDFITWMQTNKGLPSISVPFIGSFSSFIDNYTNPSDGFILPYFLSNLVDLSGTEDLTTLYLQYYNGGTVGNGGHWSVYINDIFEYIQDAYSVDISFGDSSVDYNIFEDAIVQSMYTPIRNTMLFHTATGYYFEFKNNVPFLPDEEMFVQYEDKTLYDFVNVFFQYFNCLIDESKNEDGTVKYKIRRFDDITNAEVQNFSGKWVGDPTFTPSIKKWKQNNYIKFSALYENAASTVNSKYIECKNRNIEVGTPSESLFEIDHYIPSQVIDAGDFIANMSLGETMKDFTFFISEGLRTTSVTSQTSFSSVSVNKILNKARIYELASEYNTIESIMEYPKFYEHNKWLTLNEIYNLEYFKLYFIPELNGHFFINKISGFNPSKSTKPTKIELINIPL